MITQFTKITLAAAFGFALCFAQDDPEKLAVYVSGASDAEMNKSLSSKLLVAMTQSGEYAEIEDIGSFQDELAQNGNNDVAWIAQAAKQHGADYVCAVSMIEESGTYSVAASLVNASDSQIVIVKTGSADFALESLNDLTAVSEELARQLLSPEEPPVVAPKQCEKNYNINEFLFKIRDGFPVRLKDCSSTLSKDMQTPASFGGKKLEPKSFMIQCAVDGIEKELPDDFTGTAQIVGSLTNFVQGILDSAIADSTLDPRKLVSTVGNINIGELLNDVKKLALDECGVDEPYEPPAALADSDSDVSYGKSIVSFGIRAGVNFSHTYAKYNNIYRYISGNGVYGDILGMQMGFVADFAMIDWFHIQPGLMYIQKGMKDEKDEITSHNLELPLLLSFKLATFRFNVGPYFGLCLSSDADVFDDIGLDIGLSTGIGFDTGMFYIGAFYDYGFVNMSNRSGYSFYNRTLGFNVGINL